MNKTKMLRFTRNSALLFAAVSGVLYLTGCSSEEGIDPDQKVPESALDTDSYSVYGPNQSRVHNYGNSSTRAGEYPEAVDSFTMPDFPAIPADAKDLTDSSVLNYGNPAVNSSYYVAAGKTLETGLCLKGGITIYVAGKLKVTSLGNEGAAGENKFVVLEGGELGFNDWIALIPGTTVLNYGDLFANVTVGENAKVYSATDITGCTTFGVNSTGEFFSKGTITAQNVRLNGNSVACAFIAEEELTLNDKAEIKTSYLKAKRLTLNASKVVLDNNGLVEVNRLNVSNQDTRFTVNGTNAVVAAKEFNTNNITWPKQVFAAGIAVDVETYMVNGDTQKWDKTNWSRSDFEFQVSSEDQVVYVPAAGCHGSYGQKPEQPTPDELVVEIKKVTDIEPIEDPDHGDHDHGVISATCINFGPDGTAYASYHLRGNGNDADKNPNYPGVKQKGCIEVYKDNGEGGITLGSYMIAPDYDFNHLIVDGDKIITVGNCKKKDAFIGSLPVSFASSEGVQDDFKVKQLTTNEPLYDTSDKTGNQIKVGFTSAGDGNCVVRQGDYYYVATYAGYGPLNLDFSRVNDADGNKIFTKTTGSCKHIAINGGKAAVLSLDTYDKTSSTASVNMFDANDYKFATVLRSYDKVGTVAPVDGKNVVAIDGDNVYACLSEGGLVRLNDNKKFSRGTKVPVNGMAFDDKYVYVANGSFVSVLDKTDLHEVCYYHAANEKSANYIALKNGKIYVAFGENGVQVYQLVEKEITE